MEQVDDIGRVARSDVVCMEGNGIRPSHRGDGWSVGGGDVHLELHRSPHRVLWDLALPLKCNEISKPEQWNLSGRKPLVLWMP